MTGKRWSLLGRFALLPCAAACTFDAGAGFATMRAGELQVQLMPGRARDLGDGAFLTDQGYRVRLQEARLHAVQLELLELRGQSGAGASGSFDPADPPPGFVLCHGGHCHSDDGSLVSYEEVQAVLAGSEARFEPLVTVPIDRDLDLLARERVELDEFTPSAELPRGTLERVEVEVTHLRMRGELEGADLRAVVDLTVDLPLTEPIAETLSVSIDRDGPEEIAIDAVLSFDATLFDGLDLGAFVEEGSIVVDESSPVAEVLIEWLVRTEVAIDL